MRLATRLLLGLNRCFPRPPHPFNLALAGKMTYGEWQLRQAPATLRNYAAFRSPAALLADKVVLDLGAGAGGKSVYFASLGARRVYGLDVVPYYRQQAQALAAAQGVSAVTEFITGDAAALPFPDASLDVVIANDVMEHLPDPPAALREVYRALRADGHFCIDFPPYYHPYGAHLSDAIGIPWVHAVFPEAVLIEAYKHLVQDLPDGERRLKFRLGDSRGGEEHLEYINGMRIARFRKIIAGAPFLVCHYQEIPLRPFLKPLTVVWPEFFVRSVVCVLAKGTPVRAGGGKEGGAG